MLVGWASGQRAIPCCAHLCLLSGPAYQPLLAHLLTHVFATPACPPQDVITGDTLCDEKAPVLLERMEFPDPVIKVCFLGIVHCGSSIWLAQIYSLE